MAITGAVGAALRQEAPYQAEIAMGAQLIVDFKGARSGRRPYYWYRGTRYTSPEKIPGWSFSRNSVAYAEDSAGNLIQFPANVPCITDRGLWIWGSSTNLFRNSQAFENASWTKTGVSIGADAARAPDGTMTADALIEDTSTGTHRAMGLTTVTTGQAYVASFFVQAAGRSWVSINMASGFSNERAYFNLTTGAVGNVSGGVAQIVPYAGGWYRITLAATCTATGTGAAFVEAASANGTGSYTGSGGAALNVWGAGFEPGSSATPYIPTTSAAATRAADNASISGLSIQGAPVTLAVAAQLATADGVSRPLAQLTDGTAANFADIRRGASNAVQAVVTSAGVAQPGASFAGPYVGAQSLKSALRLRATDLALTLNGGAPVAATGVSPPVTPNRLLLGADVAGTNYLYGVIERAVVLGDVDDTQQTRLAA